MNNSQKKSNLYVAFINASEYNIIKVKESQSQMTYVK